MTDKAVAMKNALPAPQKARRPTSSPIEFDVPDSPANTTMTLNPTSSVRLAPNRAVKAPVSSMKNTCTKM